MGKPMLYAISITSGLGMALGEHYLSGFPLVFILQCFCNENAMFLQKRLG
jgi:hypothetical protein